MTRMTQKKRGGSKGGVIAAIALLLVGVAAGVTYYVKPELFGVEPDPVAAGDEAGAQAAEKSDKAVSKKKKKIFDMKKDRQSNGSIRIEKK